MNKRHLIAWLAGMVLTASPVFAQVFVGTSTNPAGPLNDAFMIDTLTDTSDLAFAGIPVDGATYNGAGSVLFTSYGGGQAGEDLWSWVVGSPAPTLIGTITDVAGGPQRIDGLALSRGVLYGSVANGIENGIYQIDRTTLVSTLLFAVADSISGIDADPITGVIYGVNDTTGQLVEIDPIGATITPVANYPVGEDDIDGLAVGPGVAYLVPDEPGAVYVYDLVTNTYLTPLTSPFSAADVFSAGAYVRDPIAVPTLNWQGISTLLLLVAGVTYYRRRRFVI